jgi:hypothetical protein
MYKGQDVRRKEQEHLKTEGSEKEEEQSEVERADVHEENEQTQQEGQWAGEH